MRNIEVLLRENGIKPSYQRKRIYEYMTENKIHPTVNDIYSALVGDIPTLSKATVYNTMSLFKEKRLVDILPLDGVEARFDLTDTPNHGHFMCTECNKVYDVMVEFPWDEVQEKLDGFEITGTVVNITGVCKNCRSKHKNGKY